ncbi:MAG: riboflavin biosynthesis protein RibF [Candidatus Omnitrophota bacterium]
MKVIYITEKSRLIDYQGSILGVGIFDGVHLGHQRIIGKIVHEAGKLKSPGAILTFNPHPANVLDPKSKIKLLQSFKQRKQSLESLGIDLLFVIRFNREFAKLSYKQFFKKILVDLIRPQVTVIGTDFRFGKDVRGNVARLSILGKDAGIRVSPVAPYKKDGYKISSSLIRNLLKRGQIQRVNKFLGRPYSIEGRVVRGKKIGTKLGFPTVNIRYDNSLILPLGIFRGFLLINRRKYKAAIYIGLKPTFNLRLKKPVLEAHILHFKRSVYGQKVEVFLWRKIRSDRKFNTIESLRKAIKEDIKAIK